MCFDLDNKHRWMYKFENKTYMMQFLRELSWEILRDCTVIKHQKNCDDKYQKNWDKISKLWWWIKQTNKQTKTVVQISKELKALPANFKRTDDKFSKLWWWIKETKKKTNKNKTKQKSVVQISNKETESPPDKFQKNCDCKFQKMSKKV